MIILTTAYNCAKYIPHTLQSIQNQNFKDWECYIFNDLSTDNTASIAQYCIQGDNRFHLVNNTQKMYQGGNYDNLIRSLVSEHVCVEVDGDDALADVGVLQRINDLYADEEVWMSSGSFQYADGRHGFCNKPQEEDIRNQTFTLSHLRCWRSALWKHIEACDLKDANGEYYSVAGDLSFMFPMFEMCGYKHYRFLTDINYIYNDNNPINDHKVHMQDVCDIANTIRKKQPYHKLCQL